MQKPKCHLKYSSRMIILNKLVYLSFVDSFQGAVKRSIHLSGMTLDNCSHSAPLIYRKTIHTLK